MSQVKDTRMRGMLQHMTMGLGQAKLSERIGRTMEGTDAVRAKVMLDAMYDTYETAFHDEGKPLLDSMQADGLARMIPLLQRDLAKMVVLMGKLGRLEDDHVVGYIRRLADLRSIGGDVQWSRIEMYYFGEMMADRALPATGFGWQPDR